MMKETLTDDFETGFIGGQVWKGIEGLRDFLSQLLRREAHDRGASRAGTVGWRPHRRDPAQLLPAQLDANSKQLFATPDEGLNR
jgi:hypothetical protein